MQDYDFIETPENVELRRRLAGIGTRFIAGLLDHLIIAGALLVLTLIYVIAAAGGGAFGSEASGVVTGFIIVTAFLVYWGYFVFFELVTNGQSPGKKSQKVRVVRDGGGAIGFTDVAIRNLLRGADGLAFYAVAGLLMFITRKSQRLGDLAAGTLVVSEAVGDYSASADKSRHAQWDDTATAEALRAGNLTPEEFRALASYWRRQHELTAEARRRLLTDLVRPTLLKAGHVAASESLEAVQIKLDSVMRAILAAGATPPAGQGEVRR